MFLCSSTICQNTIFEQNKIFFQLTNPDFAHPLRNRKCIIHFVWPNDSLYYCKATFCNQKAKFEV